MYSKHTSCNANINAYRYHFNYSNQFNFSGNCHYPQTALKKLQI